MGALWTPLFSFAVFAIVFALGDIVSTKTKGLVSSIIVGAVVYIAGFWSGIIPADSITNSTLPGMMSAFGIALMIVNLGTLMNIEDLIREWKTVVIALVGLVGIVAMCFTVGTWLFGREYALASCAPISGSLIAGIISTQAANDAGRPDIGAFVMLVVAFQMFIGMPISSWMLKKEAAERREKGLLVAPTGEKQVKKINIKFIPDMPAWMQSPTMILAKLAAVACIAVWVANLTKIDATNYILNPNIAYLLFGILFAEIGFLEKKALNKANSFGILMLGTIALVPGNFASVSPSQLLQMLLPLVGLLVIGGIFIAVFSIVAGKVVGYSWKISVAIGLTCMIGYPGTQIITEEVVKSMDGTAEEKAAAEAYILPKMLVGGFVTVTIASVVLAGIIAPMIFK